MPERERRRHLVVVVPTVPDQKLLGIGSLLLFRILRGREDAWVHGFREVDLLWVVGWVGVNRSSIRINAQAYQLTELLQNRCCWVVLLLVNPLLFHPCRCCYTRIKTRKLPFNEVASNASRSLQCAAAAAALVRCVVLLWWDMATAVVMVVLCCAAGDP
mgnify:CR=1 FL=1